MANCGNFLEYAGSKCGLDVGYGKLILVYASKVAKTAADLTAAAINLEIAAGTIIGVIKGWHTVAGAPVAEISVERTATAEMKLIRPEILADVLTFESSLASNEVLSDLVKAGSLNCILVDDQGNCFGDYSPAVGKISTMLINFSTKTTSSMQSDNTTEKMVTVTARYLVKDLSVLEVSVETELVESKTLLVAQLYDYDLASPATVTVVLKDKLTGGLYTETILEADVAVAGVASVIDSISVLNGALTINFAGAIPAGTLHVSISGDTFYMKDTAFSL